MKYLIGLLVIAILFATLFLLKQFGYSPRALGGNATPTIQR